MKTYNVLKTVALFCSFSTSVWAGGYQLSEFSITNLGRSFGGAGIVGDDYSAIAFNPAGMTLKDTGVQLGATAIAIDASANGSLRDPGTHAIVSSGKKGKLHEREVLPHFFAQKKINDVIRIGLGSYIPFGLGTHYNEGWFGRTHAEKSEITAMDITPAVAFKLSNTVSIGMNLIAEYATARLTNEIASMPGRISNLNATGWDYGWSAGMMYNPTKDTRFGLSYRSKIAHKIKGNHHLAGLIVGEDSTTLEFPEHILLAAYHRIQKIGLSAAVKWTKWSRFDTLRISSTAVSGGMLPSVEEKWDNTWMLSGGLDYYYNDNWTFRTGLAWDQAGVPGAVNRTARAPDNDRWIASVGTSYMTGNWQFDFSYTHLFINSAKTWNETSGTILDAKYKMQINMLGFAAQYHF